MPTWELRLCTARPRLRSEWLTKLTMACEEQQGPHPGLPPSRWGDRKPPSAWRPAGMEPRPASTLRPEIPRVVGRRGQGRGLGGSYLLHSAHLLWSHLKEFIKDVLCRRTTDSSLPRGHLPRSRARFPRNQPRPSGRLILEFLNARLGSGPRLPGCCPQRAAPPLRLSFPVCALRLAGEAYEVGSLQKGWQKVKGVAGVHLAWGQLQDSVNGVLHSGLLDHLTATWTLLLCPTLQVSKAAMGAGTRHTSLLPGRERMSPPPECLRLWGGQRPRQPNAFFGVWAPEGSDPGSSSGVPCPQTHVLCAWWVGEWWIRGWVGARGDG